MKNAILIHGKPSKEEFYNDMLPSVSNANFLPWIQQQLAIRDIPSQTPEMPHAWKPHYPTWQKEFDRFEVTPDTALVGHSAGGGFLVRWLSEHPDVQVGKVILVAPSLGLDWDEDERKEFFSFEIDADLASRTQGLIIFGSDDDKDALKESITIYRSKLNDVDYREVSNHGHFAYEHIGSGFPELLKELLA